MAPSGSLISPALFFMINVIVFIDKCQFFGTCLIVLLPLEKRYNY